MVEFPRSWRNPHINSQSCELFYVYCIYSVCVCMCIFYTLKTFFLSGLGSVSFKNSNLEKRINISYFCCIHYHFYDQLLSSHSEAMSLWPVWLWVPKLYSQSYFSFIFLKLLKFDPNLSVCFNLIIFIS